MQILRNIVNGRKRNN